MRFAVCSMLTSIIILVMIQGCGTIIHGSSQDVIISTNPPGATARIGSQECIAPCMLNVSRKADKVYLRKGKQEKVYEIEKSFNFGSVILGNIFFYLLPGLVVDVVSGGAYTIKPINVSLFELGNDLTFTNEVSSKPSQEAIVSGATENKFNETPIKRGDSFAVLPFVVLSTDVRFSQLSKGFSENLTYHLVKNQVVKVIERTQLDKAVKEMSLSMTGAVDDSTAQSIGKIVGAMYVVIGSVEILEDHVEINCRVLQVETSENILVEKVSN